MYGQISYWAFTGGRKLVEAMAMAGKAGFDGIELCIDAEGELTPKTTSQQAKQIAAAARTIQIRLDSVATGLLWECNPASGRKQTRDNAVRLTRRCLEVTADLGVKYMLVLPGHVDVFFSPRAEVVPYDECYKRTVAFGRAIARTAEKLGVTACLENVWNRFLLSPLEMKQLIKDIDSPKVGVYFDVGNVWNLGYPQHWIKILARRIKRVHVKDFKRSVGTAAGFCQLGDGDVPLAQSLKLLERLGYKGPVTAEVSPGPDETDEMAFLRKTARRLRRLLP